MQYKVWFIALFFGSLAACTSSEVAPDPTRLGHDYFPMKVGSYRIYDMDETNYALIGPEHRVYQLRERVMDSTIVSSDEIRYTLHRETREDSTQAWSLDSVWTARVDIHRAIVTENNVAFVKLVFPIENELEWDGNAYNARSIELYNFLNSPADTTLYDELYSELWTVVQRDDGENFLGRDDRYEIYARNVGLIVKSVHVWEYCQQDCSSENQIVAGRDLTQVLIEYGED